jgi:hypothetical protein
MMCALPCRFNATVFEGQLPGDLDMSWNARLKTTAGTTHFRREPPTTLTGQPRCGACFPSCLLVGLRTPSRCPCLLCKVHAGPIMKLSCMHACSRAACVW